MLKNVYTVLVHNAWACIIDLLKNLRSCDTESRILLYNGSQDPNLLQGLPLEAYGVEVCPQPKPQAWGKLHHYTLDCLRYLLAGKDFDCLTIVDSDQLAIQDNFVPYLSAYIGQHGTVSGMIASSVEPRKLKNHHLIGQNSLVQQEFDLWHPFLKQYQLEPSGNFYNCFWPGTIFFRDLCEGLVNTYDKDSNFKLLWHNTQLFCTEENFLITAAHALGFPLHKSPLNYDYIKWRQQFTIQELRQVILKPDAFWVHPIPREVNHPLRRLIAEHRGYAVSQLYYQHLQRTRAVQMSG